MYILEHNWGESQFETISDAITALQMANSYSAEPESITAEELSRIRAIVSRGGRYEVGSCEIWATSDELP